MTHITKLSLIALVVATVALAGCKKKDDKKNTKKNTKTSKVQPKNTKTTKTTETLPKTDAKPISGKALLALVTTGWAAFDAEDAKTFAANYADNVDFKLVDMVAMMPGQKTTAATRDDMMKMVGQYWSAYKLKNMADLVLVNGSNVAVIMRSEATNDADMGPMKADKKLIKSFGAQLTTFNAKGKIIVDHHYFDQNTAAGQAGKLPKGVAFRPAWEKAYFDAQQIVAKNDDAEKKNLAAYKMWLADVNTGDAKKVLAHAADDIVVRHMDMPKDHIGKKGAAELIGMFNTAFPKFSLTSTKAWAAGNWIVSQVVFKGKNTGVIPGMIAKATNNDVVGNTVHFVRYDGGKIKEMFVFTNGFNMFAQVYPEKLKALQADMMKKMGGKMDHSKMDHGKMDHGKMDHGKMGKKDSAAPAKKMDDKKMDHKKMDHKKAPAKK